LRTDPNNTYAYYIRGSALYYQGNLDQALQLFSHALKIDPEDSKVIKLRKVKTNISQSKNKIFNPNKLFFFIDLQIPRANQRKRE
jgi:tetratricopeptide (TPR) repeat protein